MACNYLVALRKSARFYRRVPVYSTMRRLSVPEKAAYDGEGSLLPLRHLRSKISGLFRLEVSGGPVSKTSYTVYSDKPAKDKQQIMDLDRVDEKINLKVTAIWEIEILSTSIIPFIFTAFNFRCSIASASPKALPQWRATWTYRISSR